MSERIPVAGQQLYRIPEVCYLLSLSRAMVYELIASGELRSVKLGASRRVLASDLHAFVDGLQTEQAAQRWSSPGGLM